MHHLILQNCLVLSPRYKPVNFHCVSSELNINGASVSWIFINSFYKEEWFPSFFFFLFSFFFFSKLKILFQSHGDSLISSLQSGDFYFSLVNGRASAFLGADLFRPITETSPVQRALLHVFSERERAESDQIYLGPLLFMEMSKWWREFPKTHRHKLLHHRDVCQACLSTEKKVLLGEPFPHPILGHSSAFQLC